MSAMASIISTHLADMILSAEFNESAVTVTESRLACARKTKPKTKAGTLTKYDKYSFFINPFWSRERDSNPWPRHYH